VITGLLGLDDVETIVPVVAIFFIFGFPVLAWLIHRALQSRERQLQYMERIEMIRHGINPDAGAHPAGGPAPAPPSAPAGFGGAYAPPGSREAQASLQRAMCLTAVGLAITVGLSFIGMGPWLIGGFVPLFIGLARVLSALAAGAQFRVGSTFAPPTPPPPNANFAERPSSPPTYEGSYTYRPGPTQELRPPPNPPTPRDQ
jgi:hypothetical protein